MSRFRRSNRDNYAWVAGGMRGIKQVAFIARGGFGEVHQMLNERTGQIFARKIVRIFGDITHEDVETESRMLSELCRPGGSNTVVEVMNQGWLPRQPSLYYIDMEYCVETLDSRIHGAGQKSKGTSTLDSEIHEGELSTGSLATVSGIILSSNDTNKSPPGFDWQSVVNIIEDINRGLLYLHQNKTVHRDLKPKNVLFSERDGHWKLADFGTASKATSKHFHTTRYARGTTCYRAPEILKENAKINNKVDMFALGCILYEATTGQKLFTDDWEIREYSFRGDPMFPTLWPSCDPGSRLYSLGELAQSLLEVDPFDRPSALQTKTALELIRQDKVPELGMANSSAHNWVRRSRQQSPARRAVNVAQVQYRRPLPSTSDSGGNQIHGGQYTGLASVNSLSNVPRHWSVYVHPG